MRKLKFRYDLFKSFDKSIVLIIFGLFCNLFLKFFLYIKCLNINQLNIIKKKKKKDYKKK